MEKDKVIKLLIGSWVVAKRSGGKRYVTRDSVKGCFEDDGKISLQSPSPYCHYDEYELVLGSPPDRI